jgi:hypothetical protein
VADIYVATKFERFEMVRTIGANLERVGHRVTHNWALSDQFDEYGEKYAMLDYMGARDADLCLVWDHPDLRGALVEFGITLGAGGQVWFCEQQAPMIFKHLPDSMVRVFDKLTDALQELTNVY